MNEHDKAEASAGDRGHLGGEAQGDADRSPATRSSIERVWEDCDAMAYMYIWQVLLSF